MPESSNPEPSQEGKAKEGNQNDVTVGSNPPEKKVGADIIARFGRMRMLGQFRHNFESLPLPGAKVVLRTQRGVELGTVVSCIGEKGSSNCSMTQTQLADYLKTNGSDYPFRKGGRVLRLANNQDLVDSRHLRSSSDEETRRCRKIIADQGLKMKLVAVEHLLGGGRIIFYFTAESRVDFRDLVRQLASQYRTRIEMRQVGSRDEARLVADIERCGQRCCCQQYLKELKPVSMRMAKTQKATLDPAKISGRCGRLMCCLRYEDENYEYLRKKLPRRNTWVKVGDTVGKVIDTQIITQLVRILQPGGIIVAVANEEITARDVSPPAPEKPSADRRRGRPAPKASSSTDTRKNPSADKKPARRRDNAGVNARKAQSPRENSSTDKKPDNPDNAANVAAKSDTDAQAGPKKKKRRRRRRRRPPSESK